MLGKDYVPVVNLRIASLNKNVKFHEPLWQKLCCLDGAGVPLCIHIEFILFEILDFIYHCHIVPFWTCCRLDTHGHFAMNGSQVATGS